MIDLKVNTDDINKILIDISRLQNFTEQRLEKEFATTASLISKRAKIAAPVKTGFLKSSISAGKDQNVFVQASASYAYFQEFGWTTRGKKRRKIKGKKYFYPNAEIELKLLFNKIDNEINKII